MRKFWNVVYDIDEMQVVVDEKKTEKYPKIWISEKLRKKKNAVLCPIFSLLFQH